jgi:hypothetical protein
MLDVASFEEIVLQSLEALANSVTPPDLSGLNAVAAQGQRVAAQFHTLLPTIAEAATMSNPQNPAQAGIDSAVATLQTVFTTFGQVFTDLQTELASESPDLTNLNNIVTTAQAALAQFQGLDTINPPTPAPAPDAPTS